MKFGLTVMVFRRFGILPKLLVFAGALFGNTAFASIDEGIHHAATSAPYRAKLSDSDVFERTQAVLKHFGVPEEDDNSAEFDDLQGKIAKSDIDAIWKSMDMKNAFPEFVNMATSFQVFQDRVSQQFIDFSVAFSSSGSNEQAPRAFEQHLADAAAHNPSDQLLKGLRIALDPGHMGSDYWDSVTGKFVVDGHGHKLSEGLMNLQICLLLEESFKALGAEVMITHRTLAPVTDVDYPTFDLHDYGLIALRESTLDPWFQKIIETHSAGQALYDAFSASPDFKKLFAGTAARWNYFVQGYDLTARAVAMNAFDPDLSLIVHLDANDGSGPNGGINSGHDGTKMYVTGAFDSTEMGSREDRMYIARHMLDKHTHQASIALSKAIADEMHQSMGIPYDGIFEGHSLEVEPGVQTRNLHVQRRLISHPSVYFEGLYYNSPKEFAALSRATHPMDIGGVNHPYSDRLDEIHQAIRDATLQFVKSYAN